MNRHSPGKTLRILPPQEPGLDIQPTRRPWLRVLRRYLGFMAISSLMWEVLQLPLYTLWSTGSPGEIAFAVLHCSAGDMIIAATSLFAALILAGNDSWPAHRHVTVALAAIMLGLAYTTYSEWLNVYVRGSWAYSPAMPLVPLIGVGLSPVLQWVALPLAAFAWARLPPKRARDLPRDRTSGSMHPDQRA